MPRKRKARKITGTVDTFEWYLKGLKRAQKVAVGTLPIPCGGTKEDWKQLVALMGIPIRAVDLEVLKVEKAGRVIDG